MYKPISVLEENPLHVIIVYSDSLPSDFFKKLSTFIMLQATRSRKRRVVLHVFTNRENPLYLEDLRGLIQNNVALTITTRHYRLEKKLVEELLGYLKEKNEEFYIFIEETTRKIVEPLEVGEPEIIKTIGG